MSLSLPFFSPGNNSIRKHVRGGRKAQPFNTRGSLASCYSAPGEGGVIIRCSYSLPSSSSLGTPPDVSLPTSDAGLGVGAHLGPGSKSRITGEMEGCLAWKLRVCSRGHGGMSN